MAEAVTEGWRVRGFVIPVPSVILLVLAAQAVRVKPTDYYALACFASSAADGPVTL